MLKSAIREITGGFGRYIAIFAIVVIGVGFFSGLSVCKDAMVTTADNYLRENNYYDYRVLSTGGFTAADADAFRELEFVKDVNGASFTDALVSSGQGSERVIRFHSVTEDVNKLNVLHGKTPTAGDECAADAHAFKESDIGKILTVDDDSSALAYKEYKIVGICDSPQYLNIERGTSDAGNVSAFVYVPADGFSGGYYHELYLVINGGERIYGEDYKKLIEDNKDAVAELAEKRAVNARVFVLTREANVSYVSFENDSAIVHGIAKVFPAFFFLVAALMCVTTMSRMVEERRTQIGVLKSIGYGSAAVMGKYILYAGSAGVLGCLTGFFVGTGLFPQAVWKAFHMLYRFADRLDFVFDWKLLAASLAVTCVCTVGVTVYCCFAVLRGKPADLIRPKAPKAGKRTILERVTPLWNKLSFSHKVSMRNLFRYKQRFFMMIIGIGGCTALLVAGFGILDSLRNVIPDQYGKITLYDAQITFSSQEGSAEAFAEKHADGIEKLLLISAASADISIGGKSKNIQVIAPETDGLGGFMALRSGKNNVAFPKAGEIVVNSGLAEDMGMKVGDTVTVTSGSLKKAELRLSGVFDNHIGNFAYVSRETAGAFFDSLENGGAYVVFSDGVSTRDVTAAMRADGNVANVSVTANMKKSIEDTMRSLNYVVLVVILCAGALAFVVMYNLTNINITERLREIASVKVLGFYDNETSHYVFRENNILTALGTCAGLLLGKFLHMYVMAQVNIEFMKFNTYINWKSYIYSAALTLAFAFIMQILMNRRLKKINMAESLKTVE